MSIGFRKITGSLTFGFIIFTSPVAAQEQSAAHAHMGHVAEAFGNTPDGQGLLPVALAEAQVAAQHATLALRNTEDLDAMQRHAGHVLHAVDPTQAEQGPGAGYGVKRAAEGVAQHIGMAGEHESASENVALHANHVATAARNTIARSDEIIELAHQVMHATSAAEAAPTLERLAELANELVAGRDADGDGRIGWQEGEGGLQQAEQHMNLMRRGEGMGG
jgi:hypothetical protein